MSNKFKVNKYGPITERRDYSKTVNNLPVSNLVETQLNSYKEFLDEGIDQALNNIYPIISTNKRIKIEYIQGTLRFEFPEDEFDAIKLAKQKGSTYAVKVYAQLRKIDNETGETSSQEVLFCDIPLMTNGASFIINGSEKVIVSQLLRSAGAYCNLNVPIKDGSFYNRLEVIPRLGAWVEIQHKITDGTSTAKKVAKKVRDVNHEVKPSGDVEAKSLIREIERVFNQQTSIKSETELKMILKEKKTGAVLTTDGIGIDTVVFQDGIDAKYLLKGKIKNSFLVVRVILEDTENGAKVQKDIKVLAETLNASQVVVKIDKTKIGTISTLLRAFKMTKNDIKNLYGNLPIVDKSIVTDKTSTEIDAIDAIHSALRKGDRITTESRKNLFANIFFNKRRYDLSKTGRYNLNRKLNIIDRIENTFLAEDLVGIEGNVVFAKGTFIDFALANEIHEAFRTKVLPLTEIPGVSSEIYASTLEANPELARLTKIAFVKVWPNKKWMENEYEPVNIIGNDPNTEVTHLVVPDIIASIGYYLNLSDQSEKIKDETDYVSIGSEDDPDSLINKRIVAVGELLKNQLQIGLTAMERNAKERMSSREQEKITPKNITNNKSIFKQFSVFFNSSQLSQFMDQMNPLAEVSNKRRVTSLGPSGLNRDTAKFEVRDVHSTHYGRLCPIETPEGPNIGLILSFANYARVNELGFIEAPYFAVTNGVVDATKVHFLTAAEEIGKTFVQSSLLLDENGKIIDEEVTARRSGDYAVVKSTEVNFMDVSSKQITSVASSAIPFLENDDANRALMGANMQRQAVPLLKPEAPFVGTGIESEIARFSASNIHAKEDGVVEYVDSKRIIIKGNDGETQTYNLRTFERSNQGSVITQRPIVNVGQQVKAGDVLVDGPSFENGEMALGKNVVVAFTTWNGYNYEDAVIISEKLVKDDVYTSIHIEEQTLQFRKSKIGDDILTDDIPNTSKFSRRNLDDSGIVRVGSEVVPGDILVGRTSPKGEENQTPEEKLIQAIFTNKSKNVKDTSLKVKNGHGGTVINTQILSRENGDKLQDDMSMIVKVFIAQKRKIKVGDKMAGRHGNKGIISRVLPIEDMPHLEDGTPVDIMLNPQGVPSRMNIGQVLELHLGMAAKSLNVKFASPVFDGVKYQNINDALEEAGLPRNGKFDLYDPITNRKFDAKISVGVMYMLKLAHMIDDKMHARSVGPYSLITQQPLGGKSQNGGQRFGEMETWSIESYGATNVLQELLTYKSDNIEGRNKVYSALTTGAPLPEAGTPESFNVLAYELRGLGIKLSAEVKEEEQNND